MIGRLMNQDTSIQRPAQPPANEHEVDGADQQR